MRLIRFYMRIGVVIPTFNRVDKLRSAVASIISQSHQDWELWVVEDGGTDSTQQVMLEFASKDPRIHYHRFPENKGVNAARNYALDQLVSTVDFVTFLDDDDLFTEGCFERFIAIAMQQTEQPWFVTGISSNHKKRPQTYIEYYGEHDYVLNYLSGKKIKGDAVHFIHTRIIGDIRFSKNHKQSEEWIFFIQLAAKNNMFAYDDIAKKVKYEDSGLLASDVHYAQRYEIRYKMALWSVKIRPNNLSLKIRKFKLWPKWAFYRLTGGKPFSIPEMEK